MRHPNAQIIIDTTTGHLRKKDYELLQRYGAKYDPDQSPFDPSKTLIAYDFGYGWTVSTSGCIGPNNHRADQIEAIRSEGFSEEFITVFEIACDEEAVMVRFDRDGEPIPGLPIFDAITDEVLDDGSSKPGM